jgi:hypothetical protein
LFRALEGQRRASSLASGLLFGVAILMKQHAAVFAGFAVVYLLVQHFAREGRSFQRMLVHLFLFSTALALPVLLLWLYLWMEGAFSPFWFWTFTYPRSYLSMSPWEVGKVYLIRNGSWQISGAVVLYSVALVGMSAVILNRSIRPRALFLLLFTGFSFLSVCPGLHFRPHYFLLFAPAVSLLAAVGATSVGQLCHRVASPARIAVLITLIALITGFAKQFAYFFLLTPGEINSLTYPTQFDVMRELGLYIREHTQPDDRIAVLGSEPELCFYARRRSATKYIYIYPLFEPQRFALQMQEEMIADMERCCPRYLAIVRCKDSWFSVLDPDAPQLISQWPSKYVAGHYRRVVVAEMVSPQRTDYFWGTEAVSYQPRADYFMVLYERLPAP